MQRMIYRRVDCFVLTRIWNQYHYLSMIPGVSRQNNSKTLNKEYKSYSGDGNGELNTNNNIIEPEPPRPDECCASGCSICVWDTYETNMEAFQRATAQLDAPFVPHLQVSIRSSDSDNLQLQPANKSSRHEAQRVVQLMPVLLGHAPLDQQEKIRCGTVVKSIEMRKPIPGYDARRYVRDIHVIVKDTEAIPFSYSTADHSAIYSPNSPDVVRRCLKHIVNTTDTIIKSNTIVDVCAIQQTHTQAGKMNSITEEDNSSGLWSSSLSNKSAICTQHDAMENMKITASMQTLLTWGCDLHRTTTRVSTRILAQFAQDENEADELRSIASSEKRYKQIVASQFLGLGQLMEMFPSLKVPLEVILQVGSPVLPRRYTITSAPSSSQSKSSFQLLISGHHDFGKCSSHLTIPSNIFDSSNTSRANEQMTHNDSWLFFQKISSSYPPFVLEPDRPLVMVAAGCGIAPFLSMLRELEFKLHNQGSRSVPRIATFFGFHSPQHDYLYQEEFERWIMPLQNLQVPLIDMHCPVFSAVPCSLTTRKDAFQGTGGRYVQDIMLQYDKLIGEMLFPEATVGGKLKVKPGRLMVCGSTELGQGVNDSMSSILRSIRPKLLPHVRAQVLEDMRQEGRYVEELWS